jgi:NADH:ubiquinone oxidoreductase subunit F (NADH-binding)/ferredoxin
VALTPSEPLVLRVGQARVTAGLDRYERLDLGAHRSVFGPPPGGLTLSQLVTMCEQVDLRGHGGAAFPAAKKLRAVATSAAERKKRPIVVINGTEGEPGSSKDKTLLRRSPHLVLDGAVMAARALRATEIIIGVTNDGPQAQIVSDAIDSDGELRRMVKVAVVPDRFVTGESGSLINAINGKAAIPPGVKTRASDSGVRGRPTYLSNAETFAQLAVLGMLGPSGYASTGEDSEPGTVLLTVSGSVEQPSVVDTPTGVPLGHILDICGAKPCRGVLLGGYHGLWITPQTAAEVTVSRAGLQAVGSTLGAGVVLVLGTDTCPLGETARIASYMAMQSSGQCGPCKAGLPAVARSLTALAHGAGGPDELDAVRRTAANVRGRGACHHPDGTANFVASALDVFADDLAEHMFRGTCGRPTVGILPLPDAAAEARLKVDWTRCQGHGLCARLAPELVKLDADGFPEFLDVAVPFWLTKDAGQAVDMCPNLALTLTKPAPKSSQPRPSSPRPALGGGIRPPRLALPPSEPHGDMPTLTGRAMRKAEMDEAEAWLGDLGAQPRGMDGW